MKFKQKNNKAHFVLIIALLLPFFIVSCHKKQIDSLQNKPLPPKVTVSKPLQQDITIFATFSGVTEPLKSVSIRARKEGVLKKIHFKDGSIVDKDELLFSIESEKYKINLSKAKAQLVICEAETKVARKTRDRLKEAYKKNAVSEISVIEAEAKLSMAEASVSVAKADVSTAKLELSYTSIKAPINGRISRTLVDIGNLVGGNDHKILTSIVQIDPIYVYFRITEQDLLQYNQIINIKNINNDIKIPILLGLIGDNDYPIQGYIDYIDNNIDLETGTIQIRAIFPNTDQCLFPGSFVRIKIPIKKQTNALLIPDESFCLDQQGKYLLIVKDDNKVCYQPVSVGELINGLRIVTKGISSDTLVIVNGIQKALPGFTITPEEKNISGAIENINTASQ